MAYRFAERIDVGTPDKSRDRAPGVSAYNWPIFFFVGVSLWNLVGTGLFGFLKNPPIALYYVQGLTTTAFTRVRLYSVCTRCSAWA